MAHKGLQILCVILGALLGALLGAVVGAIIFISRPMCVRQLERCRRTLELALGRRKQALELRDFRRLQPRVQALPQELQDMVFEEVIRHDFNRILNKIIVKDDYKPPIALQLHRKLRASFANEYYRTAVVTSLPWSRLKAFLRALPPHHRAMVNSVHMRSPDSKTPVWDRHNMLRETRALMRGSKRKDTCFRRSIGPGTYDWEMVWARGRWMIRPPAGARWVARTLHDFQGKGPLHIVEIQVPQGEYVIARGDCWELEPVMRLLA